ncbi:prepilin-type N-terminal cleavage/methylation domain-containing protein [Cohnella sp. JJ-181]|uniref:prepilin-type N-terminal cleavage/methylation domain-containing protein n=1 Tax=Cohnella rhizoplanae TaxID=2974897 RepID=UPI0022FF987E|nr:prepilin-type N-terminal cleavage/methylation domain-containing protein [Cohnella sp. JJ-181]CAI6041039.1 hypothetical protein COHCIP112018_01088 [Cohnella sp. JJ-181]
MRTAVMKRLGKAKEDQKGFTLIELLAVIVILAVIAAIAIPLIGNIIDKSKKDSDVATARQIYDAGKLYITSELNGTNPKKGADGTGGAIKLSEIQSKGYLDNPIVLPSTKKALDTDKTIIQFSTTGALEKVELVDKTSDKAVVKSYDSTEVSSVTSTQ